jgi:hypothetical protein
MLPERMADRDQDCRYLSSFQKQHPNTYHQPQILNF